MQCLALISLERQPFVKHSYPVAADGLQRYTTGDIVLRVQLILPKDVNIILLSKSNCKMTNIHSL
jgi:hypothetical protein